MRSLDILKTQHLDLIELATECVLQLDSPADRFNAANFQRSFTQLLGKLKVHLSMEDRFLYPKLLAHKDEKVRSTASQFQEEFGGIGAALAAFEKKWPSRQVIESNAREFVKETKNLLSLLGQRIEKEDQELYPLLTS